MFSFEIVPAPPWITIPNSCLFVLVEQPMKKKSKI